MMRYFEMEDDCFDVDMLSFERSFAPALTDHAGTAADGSFYYEDTGMTEQIRVAFRARPGCEQELERLWDNLRRGGIRCCTFPQGSSTAAVYAYVAQCDQMLASSQHRFRWGAIRVLFRVVQPGEEA